jgi:hypothetical protein
MPEARSRSAAVTAAATLALLGCGSAFLFWGSYILGLVNGPADEQGRHFYQIQPLAFMLVILIPSTLIGVGIRIGIGLFKLRPWARIAAMVWATISLLFCLSIIAFRPFETFFIGDHFVPPSESMKQLVAIAMVILLLPVSVWWLFLFRMKSVKAQFLSAESGNDSLNFKSAAQN